MQDLKLIVDIVAKYTRGDLTMKSAFNLIRAVCMQEGPRPSADQVLNTLGWEITEEAQNQISIGYNDSVEQWWDAGHRPTGWHMTRPEYQASKKKK